MRGGSPPLYEAAAKRQFARARRASGCGSAAFFALIIDYSALPAISSGSAILPATAEAAATAGLAR